MSFTKYQKVEKVEAVKAEDLLSAEEKANESDKPKLADIKPKS